MKPIKLVLIGVVVAIFAFVFVLSCDTTKVKDPTQQDLEKLGSAMYYAFYDIEYGYDEEGVTFSGDDPTVPEGMTIIFAGYTYMGVTVNGSVNIKAEISGVYPNITGMNATISGTLNFSGPGAPADSVAFNLTMAVDMPDSDPNNWTITVSGTFSIDGTKFNASGIGNMVLPYLPF
jgi:hypothetical protein